MSLAKIIAEQKKRIVYRRIFAALFVLFIVQVAAEIYIPIHYSLELNTLGVFCTASFNLLMFVYMIVLAITTSDRYVYTLEDILEYLEDLQERFKHKYPRPGSNEINPGLLEFNLRLMDMRTTCQNSNDNIKELFPGFFVWNMYSLIYYSIMLR